MDPHEQADHRKPIATDARIRRVAPGSSIRLKTFYLLLPRVQVFFRRRRMGKFVRILKLKPGTRVLDLGGAPAIWEHVSVPLEITLLNLPGCMPSFELDKLNSHHTFHIVEGDACNVNAFRARSFDLVFSNSVIEHVGPLEKQKEFAREVLRLGYSYWVQTPSKWFPIEAHSGLPFYWFWPESMRTALMTRWRKRLPAWWADYISTTRVLSRRRMTWLFPDAQMRTEYFLGFAKSYIAYATSPQH